MKDDPKDYAREYETVLKMLRANICIDGSVIKSTGYLSEYISGLLGTNFRIQMEAISLNRRLKRNIRSRILQRMLFRDYRHEAVAQLNAARRQAKKKSDGKNEN